MCQSNAPYNKAYLTLTSGDRIRRLKQKAIAQFTVANPTVPDGGINSFPSSTRLIALQGAQDIPIYVHDSVYKTEPGCCCTLEVCPIGTDIDNTPFLFLISLQDPTGGGYYDFLLAAYGDVPLPTPPVDYPYDYFWALLFPPYCNSTTTTINVLDSEGAPIPSTIYNYGPSSFPDFFWGPAGLGGTVNIFPSDINIGAVSLTASNGCSSSTGDAQIFCFLAGSPVTLADGTTKPIEAIQVGDRVVGAFGETNTVTGLQQNPLGLATISNINGEHMTTSHHPHISPDHKFCVAQPPTISRFFYNKYHTVIGADGVAEKRLMKGVNQDRIVQLTVGMQLQTATGPKVVSTIEMVPMPRSTPVYHLAVDGSHTYLVDGYAVVGWADEEDFDYDAWVPRSLSQ